MTLYKCDCKLVFVFSPRNKSSEYTPVTVKEVAHVVGGVGQS